MELLAQAMLRVLKIHGVIEPATSGNAGAVSRDDFDLAAFRLSHRSFLAHAARISARQLLRLGTRSTKAGR